MEHIQRRQTLVGLGRCVALLARRRRIADPKHVRETVPLGNPESRFGEIHESSIGF